MKYEIVKDGKTEYAITTSQTADSAELFAASELQKYLIKSTDVYIPYYSDRVKRRGKEILVGAGARDYIPEEIADAGDEGFVIKTLANGDVSIAGKTGRGALYGVYAFIERLTGFKCFTKDVETIEKRNEICFDDLFIKEQPAFEYRESYSRNAWDTGFSVKNKLNANLAPIPEERGGRTKFFNCHHSFFDLVPPKLYRETHPEYYSVAEGENAGKQLCLSNNGTFEVARNTLIGWIKNNPGCKVFSVSQEDGTDGYCRCEKCRATDEKYGSPSGSIISFANRLAESIENEYPDVLLHTFAYRYSRKAPKGLKAHKNVIVRLCNIECERGLSFEKLAARNDDSAGCKSAAAFLKDIDEWSQVTDRLYIWDYAVNYRHYLVPMLPISAFAENIRYYKAHGVKGVLMEGNFSYGGDVCMGDLKNYLFAKLLFDPAADEKKLTEEFMRGVFGKGAPYLLEYVALAEEAEKNGKVTIYDNLNAGYYDDELVKKFDELFLKALEAETDERIRDRIRREYLSVEYMKAVSIENDEERAVAADELFEKLKSQGVTELVERTDLRSAIKWIKDDRYAVKTADWYGTYYIIR